MLTFSCTVLGGVATLWKGTAFDCTERDNEILLRHGKFADPEGTSGGCNLGAIVGTSVQVEGTDCYTSQLSVNISDGLNNKTVGCILNSDSGMPIVIGETSLSVITGTDILLAKINLLCVYNI